MRSANLSFSGPSVHDGELEDFSFDGDGTTVLAFFPGAFTGPCTDVVIHAALSGTSPSFAHLKYIRRNFLYSFSSQGCTLYGSTPNS